MGSASTPTPTVHLSILTGEEERCIPFLLPAASATCFLPAKTSPGLVSVRRRRASLLQCGRTPRGTSSQARQPAAAFPFSLRASARQGRLKSCKPLIQKLPEVCRAAASLRARRRGLGDWLARQRGAGRRVQQAQQEHTPAPCSLKP